MLIFRKKIKIRYSSYIDNYIIKHYYSRPFVSADLTNLKLKTFEKKFKKFPKSKTWMCRTLWDARQWRHTLLLPSIIWKILSLSPTLVLCSTPVSSVRYLYCQHSLFSFAFFVLVFLFLEIWNGNLFPKCPFLIK